MLPVGELLLGDAMRDYTEEELKMLSDVLPNIALQLRTSLSTIYMAVDLSLIHI